MNKSLCFIGALMALIAVSAAYKFPKHMNARIARRFETKLCAASDLRIRKFLSAAILGTAMTFPSLAVPLEGFPSSFIAHADSTGKVRASQNFPPFWIDG
jgi:hypothetical protein